MEDLVITNELATPGSNRIQGTKDGQILIQVRNGIIFLATKEKFNTKPNHLSDIFTFYRLSSSLSKYENFFKNVAHHGIPEMGETKTNMNTSDSIGINHISISDSGVSSNLECLFLIVTDAFNGIIYEFENGSLNPICLVNEEIAESENIDTSLIISEHDMRLLRINYMIWLNGIDFKYFKSPVWPLATSSCFICFNESNEIWMYRYDCFSKKIYRIISFELNLNQQLHECVLHCEQSKWIELDNDQLAFTFAVVTSTNRIFIKNCFFSLIENSFTFSDDEKILEFTNTVINYKLLNDNEKLILCVVTTETIEFYNIKQANETKLVIPLNNVVIVENFVSFQDSKDLSISHLLASNSFGEITHVKFNTTMFEVISTNKYDYFNKINCDELPLFAKLNNLNERGKFIIDSLTIDSTHNFIYLMHLPVDNKSNFVFGNTKKDILKFAVIKAQNDCTFDINNISIFNSITTSPGYWKCMNFAKMITNTDVNKDKNNENKISNLEIKDSSIAIDNKDNSIISELILNKELDNERISNAINGYDSEDSIFQIFKRKIQKKIALKVINMKKNVDTNEESEQDMFMYFQYCKLLGQPIPDTSICKMRVYGTNLIESFDVGHSDLDKILKERQIVSLQGHTWSICDVTLLPILSPSMMHCKHCNSIRVGTIDKDASNNGVLSAVLAATPLCVFCGGRYV
jgi:hypothetical protein